jgi:uncharacterized RDD family membrane protein YckC
VTQEDTRNAAGAAQDGAQPGVDAPSEVANLPRSSTYAVDPEAYQVASTGRRAGAWMLDLLLAIALTSVVAAIFGAWQPVTRTVTSDDGTIWTAYTYYLDATWSYSLMLFFSAWAIPLWKMRAATPAQRLLGLRVLDETEPRLLSWPRAAVRWFVLFGWTFVGIASTLTPYLSIVVLLWIVGLLISEMNGYRNQGLHDRWARSIVVSARKTLRPAWA